MRTPFIERDFILYFKYTDENGKIGRRLWLFGVGIIDSKKAEAVVLSGFMLSLFQLVLVKQKPLELLGQGYHSIPLLKLFVGPQISAEISHPEDSLRARVRGIDYVITPCTRFTAYNNIKRFHHISEETVYTVTSADDPKLPKYSFAPKVWNGRRPTANEAVNKAHEVYDLMADLLNVTGRDVKPQPTE